MTEITHFSSLNRMLSTMTMKTTCSNCGAAGFAPAEQEITLDHVLHEWEVMGELTFPQQVWADYADRLQQPIRLHRCANCGFQQFMPPVDGSAAFYKAITTTEGGYYTKDRWEFRQALAAIRRHGGRTVLDVGCGSGEFLRMVQAQGGHDCYGYDFNPDPILAADLAGISIVRELTTEALPGGADVITAFQVLEHVSDPWSFGQTLRRLLKPGGLLIVTTPDSDGPISFFTNSVTDLPPHHVTRWNARSMTAFGRKIGVRERRIAHEPLPDYVWRYYLPAMLRSWPLPSAFKAWCERNNRINRFLGLLEKAGIRTLPPLRGHSLYAEFNG